MRKKNVTLWIIQQGGLSGCLVIRATFSSVKTIVTKKGSHVFTQILFSCSRKRRAEESHTFKAENIIILSIQDVSNNDANAETVIELLVLDPSSTSLLPNSAFSSEDLVKYIKILQVQGKFKNLKSVDRHRGSKTSPSSGDSSSSKAPIVAGVIVAIVVIAFAVCAVWLYHRRRRNKK